MRLVVASILTILFVSCGNIDGPKKPKNLIPKDKMAHLILDLSLLRSAEGTYKTKLETEGYSLESYIYSRHQIDSVQFALSNEYYSYDLDTYLKIYEKVEDSLQKLKEFYDNERVEKTKERKINDSIKRNRKIKLADDIQLIEPIKSEDTIKVNQELEEF